jgi:hypothetical protein
MSSYRIQKHGTFPRESIPPEQPIRGSYRRLVSGAYGLIDEAGSKVI